MQFAGVKTMKLLFKSILVAFFSWVVFRIVYLVMTGNSLSKSFSAAIGAPVRFSGALVKLVTSPAQAQAALKTIRSDFSGVNLLNFKDMSTRWEQTVNDVYASMGVDPNNTSQNAATVNVVNHVSLTPPVSPTGAYSTDPATPLAAWGNSAAQLQQIYQMTQ